MRKASIIGLLGFGLVTPGVYADYDFGQVVERILQHRSERYFGISGPLGESAKGTVVRKPGQEAGDLVKLAKGLHAEILTRDAGNSADMFSFWPNEDTPTHLIFCIEGGDEVIGTFPNGAEKLNPSVQRVDVNSGAVETILRGMNRCDGIRTTEWGTVLATEETSDGMAYEIIDPLGTTNHQVTSRGPEAVIVDDSGSTSHAVAVWPALPTMAWEGLTVLENGVVIAGDELRPGSDEPDADGGAIFKFVPENPHPGGFINELSESPFASGKTYALRADCREEDSSSFPQYGQGCEIGNSTWVAVNAATARADANQASATGYYRPEDLHRDPVYSGDGVRFCWTNTGREDASNYGEVICGVESDPMYEPPAADIEEPLLATVVVNRFVEGDPDFNSVDNLAFQPTTGIIYVIEDHENGDIFACLRDGDDRDIKSDGCVKILSVRDQSAEPTGFEFTGDGKTAYLSIQHSDDEGVEDFDNYRTDDIIKITGFKTH